MTYVNNTSDTIWIYNSSTNGSITRLVSIGPGASYTETVTQYTGRVIGNLDGTEFYTVAKMPGASTTPFTFTINSANDTLYGDAGDDKVFGQVGNDVIYGGTGLDLLDGGTGNDVVRGEDGADTVSGGDGNDSLYGGLQADVMSGGNGSDYIEGNEGADNIHGGAGNDDIHGGAENDRIDGDSGNDTISGDAGDDTLLGNIGDDSILGGAGIDSIDGEAGNDTLLGEGEADKIAGGSGYDSIEGGAGDDALAGGSEADVIKGGADNDLIEGGYDNDTLTGDGGSDTIYGNSSITGGAQDDDPAIVAGKVTENDVKFNLLDGPGTIEPRSWTTIDINGVPHLVTARTGFDGWLGVYRVNNDGTLTKTDWMTYQDGSGGSTKAVITGSDGNITGNIPAANLPAFGNALLDMTVANVGGVQTLFVVSQNGSGLTSWTFKNDGTLDLKGSIQYGSSQGTNGGITKDIEVYTAGNGKVYIYADRSQNDFISRFEYNPASGTFTEDTTFHVNTADEPNGITSIKIGTTDYFAVSNKSGLQIFEVNSTTGALTLKASVSDAATAGIASDVESYVTPNGDVYLTYSNTSTEQVMLYKVGAGGTLTLTDTLTNQGDFAVSDGPAGYIDGQPVIIVPDLGAGVTRIFTIDENGHFKLQTEVAGIDDKSNPATVVQTADGSYYLVNGGSGQTVKLDLITEAAADKDVIDGGDGVDFLYGQTGDDSITVGIGDTADGGDDRDVFTITKDQLGTGTTFTINGGTGSTAAGDIDDFDRIVLGSGLSIVKGSVKPVLDEASGPGKSWSGTFQVTDGKNTYTVNFSEIEEPICFALGTRIVTDRGEVAVESLCKGDLVLTKDNGFKPIMWIGSCMIDRQRLEANPKFYPIRISAGALGAGLPKADLFVSPQHRMLVRSKIAQRLFNAPEVLVAAKQLCQIEGIDIADDVESVTYFHFLFDEHQIVLANGAESESLYTGAQALKSVGPAALEEIFAIFPELRDADHTPIAARELVSGRMGRKLAIRHVQNGKPLIN